MIKIALTNLENRAFNLIKEYKLKKGRTPSTDEIAENLWKKKPTYSKQMVNYVLERLESKKYIKRVIVPRFREIEIL